MLISSKGFQREEEVRAPDRLSHNTHHEDRTIWHFSSQKRLLKFSLAVQWSVSMLPMQGLGVEILNEGGNPHAAQCG